jgi:cobalt/nickel transport system permease protein
MAFVMPFAGYYIYKTIAGRTDILSKRSLVGVFMGSYAGINLAALFTAVEFGIQPLLFKTAEGHPLYGFFPLSVSVPVMMFEHLIFAGPIEAVVTVSAIVYLAKLSPQLLKGIQYEASGQKVSFFKRYKAFLIGLLVLIVLTPLGLFATGTAWGEWGTDEIKEMWGYVPQGLNKFSDFWKALMPDYSIPGMEGSFLQSSVGYIASAVIGILVITILLILSARFIAKKKEN